MSNKNKNSLNSVAFYALAAVAFVYLITTILANVGLSVPYNILGIINMIAQLCILLICIILAWRFVANKATVWKVLYFLVVLIIVVCMVLSVVL